MVAVLVTLARGRIPACPLDAGKGRAARRQVWDGSAMRPELQEIWVRFARFGFVGALGLVVNSAVLFAAHGLAGLPLAVASPLAVEVAIIHNFLWNDRWTFGANDFSFGRLARFNLTSLGGLVIASGTLYALAVYCGVHYILANLVGVGVATAWNFGTSLLWTWGSRR